MFSPAAAARSEKHGPRRMAVDEGPAACGPDDRVEILDLALDGVRLCVAAVASTATVVGVDGERRRERDRQLGLAPARVPIAPETRMSGGPSPDRSRAIVVPSRGVRGLGHGVNSS